MNKMDHANHVAMGVLSVLEKNAKHVLKDFILVWKVNALHARVVVLNAQILDNVNNLNKG